MNVSDALMARCSLFADLDQGLGIDLLIQRVRGTIRSGGRLLSASESGGKGK